MKVDTTEEWTLKNDALVRCSFYIHVDVSASIRDEQRRPPR
jgi:hypothetical protein